MSDLALPCRRKRPDRRSGLRTMREPTVKVGLDPPVGFWAEVEDGLPQRSRLFDWPKLRDQRGYPLKEPAVKVVWVTVVGMKIVVARQLNGSPVQGNSEEILMGNEHAISVLLRFRI